MARPIVTPMKMLGRLQAEGLLAALAMFRRLTSAVASAAMASLVFVALTRKPFSRMLEVHVEFDSGHGRALCGIV